MAVPLKIVIVAPPWFEIPPRAYGGIEWVCFWLVEGLVELGHDVTLIGAGDARTAARFRSTFAEPPRGLGEPAGAVIDLTHAARAIGIIEELQPDIVHDHSAAGPLAAALRSAPTVLTAHGPVTGAMGDLYASLPRRPALVAISEAQRRGAPDLPWHATIHNGIPVRQYPWRGSKDDFALFVGRMSPSKGPHLAIDAARSAGSPIVLAGKCTEAVERDYFDRELSPRLGPDVTWIGEADTALKKDLYARARCLVSPIQWEEPFGLVMVEAMACGTPVVAFGRGSVPELVVDGVTGWICSDVEQLAEGIKRADVLDPRECRQHVADRFDASLMVRRYERVYADVLCRAPTSG